MISWGDRSQSIRLIFKAKCGDDPLVAFIRVSEPSPSDLEIF